MTKIGYVADTADDEKAYVPVFTQAHVDYLKAQFVDSVSNVSDTSSPEDILQFVYRAKGGLEVIKHIEALAKGPQR